MIASRIYQNKISNLSPKTQVMQKKPAQQSFGGLYPVADSLVHNGQHLPCPYCGFEMLNISSVLKLLKVLTVATGRQLTFTLRPVLSFIEGVPKQAAEEVLEAASLYPSRNFMELFKDLAQDHLPAFRQGNIDAIWCVGEKVDTLIKNRHDKERVLKFLEATREYISSESGTNFDKIQFLNDCDNLLLHTSTPHESQQMVMEWAKMLPSPSRDLNAFFVRKSQLRGVSIIRDVLTPRSATLEHVHPETKGGMREDANLLPVCMRCNNDRGNMPLKDFNSARGGLDNHIKKFFAALPITPDVQAYVKVIKNTLKEESEGALSNL